MVRNSTRSSYDKLYAYNDRVLNQEDSVYQNVIANIEMMQFTCSIKRTFITVFTWIFQENG